jgi:hypothetical protein
MVQPPAQGLLDACRTSCVTDLNSARAGPQLADKVHKKQEEVASQRRLDAEMEAARVTALQRLEVWASCMPIHSPQHQGTK